MAELKTQETDASVVAFLDGVVDAEKRQDCWALVQLMQEVTGQAPKLWGPSIVGFGRCHYRYASGHEGDTGLVAFSPRKPALTVYILGGFDAHSALMEKLGKHKVGKGCLYIKRLRDVDLEVLRKLVEASVTFASTTWERVQ